ncbi:GMC oxidoreductase [Stipitochalara longipes BDJ]|nr:GMC oxidoreductase [Stipitochalara longipes BDJ]
MSKPVPCLVSIDAFLEVDFDFIVVGGGTAGLVVAARLTEKPNVHVGVLEAGPTHLNDPLIMTPALYSQTVGNPEYDWLHRTTPQEGFSGRVYDYSRGKGLGGSGAINFEMYNRGQAVDYYDWQEMGNQGWSFEDLLPYFKKHEGFDDPSSHSPKNNIPLEMTYNPNFHGSGVDRNMSEAWEENGESKDGWSGDHIGTFHSLSSIDRSCGPADGTRSYAVTGYLLPNASRPNLNVLTDALVFTLTVENESIHGVEFLHLGKLYSVKTKKEVLSAGAFKSPQTLELSGIGNPDILSRAIIKCQVENRRVGENLHDHTILGMGFEFVDGEQSLDALSDPAVAQKCMEEYTSHRAGPFSSSSSATNFGSFANVATPEEIKAVQSLILDGPDPASGGHTMMIG